MKKIVFMVAALFLVAAGCNSSQTSNTGSTNTQTPVTNGGSSTNGSSSGSSSSVGQNSSSSGLVFSSKATSGPAADLYKGQVTLNGNFEIYPQDQIFGNELVFNVDADSQNKLPQKWGEYPKIIDFDNQSQAKQMLGAGTNCTKGTATIVIKDYTSILLEGEVMDSTTLVQVLKSSCN